MISAGAPSWGRLAGGAQLGPPSVALAPRPSQLRTPGLSTPEHNAPCPAYPGSFIPTQLQTLASSQKRKVSPYLKPVQ